ncbi:apolipoprotein N-acyltransferase [Microbulbifer hydrolyticus]|uniref:Apolipoprotein N-acyltransferase n=1 Tax=Microbulbifer hydrolyticus TaxID=48074 RepID=A0A6P1TAG5_9GAMM|nr:apolipoprotein N-acyltransferase [Microbulbifer hydrolyticus]MBB5212079.1 apolipoprotein N-acyltransferase [Microbulbifer hydrolyticus]QHQ39754.1 apolipoprotein N-acyltransferase [Microbulbifer hydrolyticus]
MRKFLPSLAALFAGGLLTLSFAPYNLWWCSLLSLGLFAWLLAPGRDTATNTLSGKANFWLALWFGAGLFATGGSWVYVSITDFGNSSPVLGVILTGAFVGILALVFALPFTLLARLRATPLSFALSFAALWFVSEWLRTWMFTGFPWLFAGYGHIHTWLAGWAPVLSVYGIGMLLAFCAAVAALFARRAFTSWKSVSALSMLAVALLVWPAGLLLSQLEWTHGDGSVKTVGLVQANIPQDKKWLPEFRGETIRRYQTATEALQRENVDLVIWPEAALPLLYHHAPNLMEALQNNAQESETDLITGILYDTEQDLRRVVHNSAAVFGHQQQLYHKRHLVPFGEYVPLEDWIRGTIEFFNLPTSFIRPGPEGQQPLQAGGLSWAPLICYEIVYPQLVAKSSGDAGVLLTLSNDAWFGRSIGPLQHMQMAQMRALETRRYLVRGTNTGVTAIVAPDGTITKQLPQFEQATLIGEVESRRGHTPFMLMGVWGLVVLAALMLLFAVLLQRRPTAEDEAVFAREATD